MWINLTDEEVKLVKDALNSPQGDQPKPEANDALLRRIEERETPGPNDAAFIAAMEERYRFHPWTDGDIDFDSDPVVSQGDDGAYVMAWFWVRNELAGIEEPEEEDE